MSQKIEKKICIQQAMDIFEQWVMAQKRTPVKGKPNHVDQHSSRIDKKGCKSTISALAITSLTYSD